MVRVNEDEDLARELDRLLGPEAGQSPSLSVSQASSRSNSPAPSSLPRIKMETYEIPLASTSKKHSPQNRQWVNARIRNVLLVLTCLVVVAILAATTLPSSIGMLNESFDFVQEEIIEPKMATPPAVETLTVTAEPVTVTATKVITVTNVVVGPTTPTPALPTVRRVLLRAGTGPRHHRKPGLIPLNEGIGSTLQKLKGSIVLAKALDAEFILAQDVSTHNYSNSAILNEPYFYSPDHPAAQMPLGEFCILSDYLPITKHDRTAMIRGLCMDKREANIRAGKLRKRLDLRNCTVILDDVEKDYFPDLSGCYRDYVRDRLNGIEGRRSEREADERTNPDDDQSQTLTIGIHLRWGDVAKLIHDIEHPRGSVSLPNVRKVVAAAREKFKKVDIRIAMEHHNKTVLDLLGFDDYKIIDSKDAFRDIHELADNDLLLLGRSSYAALAHLLSDSGGLTLYEPEAEEKYTNTTRTTINFESYDDQTLDHLFASYPSLRASKAIETAPDSTDKGRTRREKRRITHGRWLEDRIIDLP